MPGFASYGAASVDLAAPGADILSTLPGAGWGSMSGTSTATPHVTGAAALILSLWPAIVGGGGSGRAARERGHGTRVRRQDPHGRASERRPGAVGGADRGGLPAGGGHRSGSRAREQAARAPAPARDPGRRHPARRDHTLRLEVQPSGGVAARTAGSHALLGGLLSAAGAAHGRPRRRGAAEGRAAGRRAGPGPGPVGAAGSRVVRVRLSARARRLLKRARPQLLTLTARATDDAGNRATVRRPLRLTGWPARR